MTGGDIFFFAYIFVVFCLLYGWICYRCGHTSGRLEELEKRK